MIYHFLFIVILILNLFVLEESIKFYIRKIKDRFIDKPNFRSMHQSPTPTGAGVLILLSCLLSFSSLFLFHPLFTLVDTLFKTILICTPLCILGFWDDYKNINQKFRYLIQLLTAIFLLINSNLSNIDFINYGPMGVLILLVFLIAITGLINFINFMDGKMIFPNFSYD